MAEEMSEKRLKTRALLEEILKKRAQGLPVERPDLFVSV
jgi:hypothetical protein